MQIYKRQARDWLARHPSLKGFRLAPALPVVLYTGIPSWPRLPGVAELVQQGEEFGGVFPEIDPLYVNLPEMPAARLEDAGPLGWVLELIQQRRARPEAFRAFIARLPQKGGAYGTHPDLAGRVQAIEKEIQKSGLKIPVDPARTERFKAATAGLKGN